MKTYALIQNGVVINIVQADAPERFGGQGFDAVIDATNVYVGPGFEFDAKAGTFTPPDAPVAAPPRIITVPAFLRRFDAFCNPPRQAAIACDDHPICKGLMALALTRVGEGIDLDSASLPSLLAMLVNVGKLSQAEADAIRTSPVEPSELFQQQ
ncbi:MAG: hypothetical protein JNM52_08045 [Betaproteobacteria bacterium]|nr:hypothetical protein [Betaproteobacteria bacterium]